MLNFFIRISHYNQNNMQHTIFFLWQYMQLKKLRTLISYNTHIFQFTRKNLIESLPFGTCLSLVTSPLDTRNYLICLICCVYFCRRGIMPNSTKLRASVFSIIFRWQVSVRLCTMEMGQKIYQYAEKLITIMLEMDWGLPVVAEFKPNTMGECRVTPHNVSITLQLLLIRKAY